LIGISNGGTSHYLTQIFSQEEVTTILSIPISHTNQEDQQIWRGTATGVFSVRSAYHIEKDRELAAKAGGSSRDRNSHIWRSIWKLSILSVEKNFLWRACKNILPTRDNLCRRKILSDPLCPLCKQEVETTFHILWQCISARDVWGSGSVIFQKSCYSKPDFLHVTEDMITKCTTLEFQQFVGVARRLWLRRNTFIHDGSFLHPTTLLQQVKKGIEDFQLAQPDKPHGISALD
jgi:hypothetical protein